MRIVVVGPSYQSQTYSVAAALRSIGNKVLYYPMTEFYVGSNYWQRKLYKFGVHCVEERYNEKQAREFKQACDKFSPDFIFVLNGLMISQLALEYVKCYKSILWLWDGLTRCPILEKIIPYFKDVFVFEHRDVEKLKARGIRARYLPLGYDDNIFYPSEQKRDIDISFIGIPNKDRLDILNKIARYAYNRNFSLFVGGPWYSKRHFWKEKRFKKKNPYLYRYLCNRIIPPQEAADIYRRSKICLNINVREHNSLNPRSFEILATKSLMLMNGNIDYRGIISDSDFVQFQDDKDVLDKIGYILANEKYRDRVSTNGFMAVSGIWSYKELMKDFLLKVENEIMR